MRVSERRSRCMIAGAMALALLVLVIYAASGPPPPLHYAEFGGEWVDEPLQARPVVPTNDLRILDEKALPDTNGSTDLELAIQQNSETLPTRSAFGVASTEHLCTGADERRCVHYVVERPAKIAVSPANKFLLCIIPKNGATITGSAFCYLKNPERFRAAKRQLHDDYDNFCNNTQYVFEHNRTLDASARLLGYASADAWFAGWTTAVVVRDPIEHFLSGYVDVCVRRSNPCYGCFRNMSCFIERHYEHSMRFRTLPFGEIEQHIRPQSNNCQLGPRIDQYEKIRFEHFAADLALVMRRAGVDQRHIQYIVDGMTANRTPHSTADTLARRFYSERLYGSAYLMEYVIRMMYEDFKLLNFRVPIVRFAQ